jgi:hypothetical protein
MPFSLDLVRVRLTLSGTSLTLRVPLVRGLLAQVGENKLGAEVTSGIISIYSQVSTVVLRTNLNNEDQW